MQTPIKAVFLNSSFPPNAKPPRHVIRTILLIWLMLIVMKQSIHIVILRHLPPLVPLLLLGQHLARQRCRGAVLKTTRARSFFLAFCFFLCGFIVVGRRGLCGCSRITVRFFLGMLPLLLTATWCLLERVCEALFPERLDAEIEARDICSCGGCDGDDVVFGKGLVAL